MAKPSSSVHDWLTLVSTSGLVISEPVLAYAFPDGPEHVEPKPYRDFIREWERYQQGLSQQREDAQSRWLRFIVEELLGLTGEHWLRPPNLPETVSCQLVDYEQVLRPSWVLAGPAGEHELLLTIVPPTQGLDRKEDQSGKWRASPAVKLERLLRETKVQLGLLTNGREFRLILAPAGLSASHLSFEAGTWADEKATLDGFFTLLRQPRFFGPEAKRLSKLIAESQEKQLEVTDQLGDQVRAALEDFVRGLDQADRQAGGELLQGLAPDKLYEMSLIVMMRLVFMLYAEENYLLPHGEVLYDQGYGVTHLYTQLAEQRQHRPESMATTTDAWPRLLATFRLIHDGCTHPDLNLIAYGGKLFNPERFPVLEDRRLRVSNAVIYAILRRLCFARAKLGRETVPQRLSYQSLDIEQIGTVYEGLIDYTVKRAPEDETLVIVKGKDQSLRPLSEVSGKLTDSAYLQEQTGFSATRVQRLLAQQEIDDETPDDLPAELLPYAGFFEGAIPPNHLYVAHQSGLRKGQGTYYTPKWITSFICERTLEPLVYDGEDETRRLKSPEAILALKVCDPAMGSGAFLVQACRYLADRLVDAWDRLVVEQPDRTLTMPYGKPLNGGPREMVLPESHDEAVMWARRFVAEHCLYGVDLNPLAVELAKMSLWLITLSKDKPFEFFDHKLKHGNSLIGCWSSDLERYPAAAWDRKGAEGAVKEALKQIKKDAKAQSDKQAKDRAKGIVPLIGVDVAALRAETAAEMREIDEVSTFDPQQKERLYRRNIEQDERYQALKRMFDTWCALWFWPLQGGEMSADLPLAFAYPELLGHYLGADRLMADPERLERWAETVGKLWEQERFFHWELEFPEVFEEGRGGFDAVIGNPPYVRVQNLTYSAIDTLKQLFRVARKRLDISLCFFERGLKCSRFGGTVSYVSTAQALIAEYGEGLRELLLECDVGNVWDFGGHQVFEGITTYVAIYRIRQQAPGILEYVDFGSAVDVSPQRLLWDSENWPKYSRRVALAGLSSGPWRLRSGSGLDLYDALSRAASGVLGDIAKANYGINPGGLPLYLIESVNDPRREIEPELLKEVVAHNESVQAYAITGTLPLCFYPYQLRGQVTAVIDEQTLRNDFPRAYAYVCSRRDDFTIRKSGRVPFSERDDWYAMVAAGDLRHFALPKIACRGLGRRAAFAPLDPGILYYGANVPGISTGDPELLWALLALLNSTPVNAWLSAACPRKQGDYYRYSPTVLNSLPVPESFRQPHTLEALGDLGRRASLPQADATETLSEIDELVLHLYGLQ